MTEPSEPTSVVAPGPGTPSGPPPVPVAPAVVAPPGAPTWTPAPPVATPHPLPPPAPSVPTPRRRNRGRWLAAVLVPVLAIVVFTGGVAVGGAESSHAAAAPDASLGPSLGLIQEAWDALHKNYVDAKNLNDKDLIYGAIRGMTDAVGDEGHTSFLTADEAKAVDQSLSGSFVGIGVQIDSQQNGDGAVIQSIIPNTPAEAAGLQRGDVIVAVDGTSTKGMAIDAVVSKVRGPEGQDVTLTIERAGKPNFDVTITRKKFDLPLVSWAMVPGRKIAMIRLDQFATGATKAIQDAITSAKNDGATAIIFDLRGNPGGYVNEAVGVASQFVGDGTVYRSIDATGVEKDIPVQSGGLATDIPLVVLTDGSTASSAEIVTGAIQDAKRGTVVGEKTFGTGTVLGRFDLSDGSSLRIGVERWLTRDGRPIWHEGLEPDITVPLGSTVTPVSPDDLKDMTAAQLAKSQDAQLLKALEVLKGDG